MNTAYSSTIDTKPRKLVSGFMARNNAKNPNKINPSCYMCLKVVNRKGGLIMFPSNEIHKVCKKCHIKLLKHPHTIKIEG